MPLKWPENFREFDASMNKLATDKGQSEQILYDGIVNDIDKTTTFVKQ